MILVVGSPYGLREKGYSQPQRTVTGQGPYRVTAAETRLACRLADVKGLLLTVTDTSPPSAVDQPGGTPYCLAPLPGL